MSIIKLPSVGRIRGISLERDDDPQKAKITLEYADHTQQLTEVDIPLLDALYLLNLLEAMSKDENFDHLRQPPGEAH